jgi:hypothetical protein
MFSYFVSFGEGVLLYVKPFCGGGRVIVLFWWGSSGHGEDL